MARGSATISCGGTGSGGGAPHAAAVEVVRAAEAARLHRLTQEATLDYAAVAVVSWAVVCWCAGMGGGKAEPVWLLLCAARCLGRLVCFPS